jgi:hypothetical protein
MDDLGALPVVGANAPAVFGWDEVIDLTGIAGSGNGEKEISLDTNYDFWVDAIGLEIWNPSASSNVPAFTPAMFAGSTSDAADLNDWLNRAAFRLELRAGSLDFWSGPMRASLAAGTVQYPRWIKTPRGIAGGTKIRAKLYNDRSLVTVDAQVVLHGRRRRR